MNIGLCISLFFLELKGGLISVVARTAHGYFDVSNVKTVKAIFCLERVRDVKS